MSSRSIAAGQVRLSASRPPGTRASRAWGNVLRYLLALACAALSLVPTASSSAGPAPARAASRAATFPPYPAKCPLSTRFFYGANCLVNEGLRPCVGPKVPGCMAVTAGPGSGWGYFIPRANDNLRISASTTTVPIGGSVTVTASVAAPVCTYALLNAAGHPRCWDGLSFAGSTYYVPTGYNGEFTAPRISFQPSCSVEGERSRVNPMSCTATVLPPFGLRVLSGHYIVVVMEVQVNNDGPFGELDVDELALKIGPAPPCMGPLGAALEAAGRTGAALQPGGSPAPVAGVDLSVYEASYCSQHDNPTSSAIGYEAACGPGYGSMPTQSPNVRTDLCIYISQLGKPTCGISYDPPNWVVSQEGLDKFLGHPKASNTSLP
jgi:hypothetical protein